MTGRILFTPEAERQLRELEDWIAHSASSESAMRYVRRVLDHIDQLLLFPSAGRARDDVRPGLRTATYRKRTVVAYVVDTDDDIVILTVLGVFHGGRDWPRAIRDAEGGTPDG